MIEYWQANSAVHRIWSEKTKGPVRILLESKKFCFDQVEFEIDGLLETPGGILLNECKSNIRKADIQDLSKLFHRLQEYVDRLGLDEVAIQHIKANRVECVLVCESFPSDVVREIKQLQFTAHAVAQTGAGYELLDVVFGKRGLKFP